MRFRPAAALTVLALVASLFALDAAPVSAQAPWFDFNGGGFGHGVGMSQYGAKGRADAGQPVNDILAAYYPGTALTAIATQPVRVKLGDVGSTTLTQAGGALTVSLDGATPVLTAGPGETLTLGNTAGAVAAQVGAGPPAVLGALAYVNFAQGTPMLVGAFGRRYQWGRLVVRPAANGGVELIVDSLSMQQYLFGLGEVPSSWPTEALRAQAIAGRTFAAYRLAHPQNAARFDLFASVADQAYVGAEKELGEQGNRWVQAVLDTDGQVLTYGGQVIQAFYSSSNGGHSEASDYVWAASLPYLRAARDPFDAAGGGNPNFRWKQTYSGDELAGWLQAAGRPAVGPVMGLDVESGVGASGRLDKATIRVRGTAGTYTLSGNALRAAVNAAAPSSRDLRSTRFSISGGTRPPSVPGGSLEVAFPWGDAAVVVGWGVDLDDPFAAIPIHLYVNGRFAGAVAADRPRELLGQLFPWIGPNHGFAAIVMAPGARATVCAYAINIGPGSTNPLLGCREITRFAKAPPKKKRKVVKKPARRTVRRR